MKDDTIIIFQKPELYFFPHYKDMVFSPFGIPERSIRYLIYKVLYLLNLPCCSIFWGDWKEKAKTARQVIIFDYGYQKGMEKYIKKQNPNCRVSLFFWNIITKERINHKLFSDKTAIYSTDKKDCQKYHLKYNHMFYPEEFRRSYREEYKDRLFFIGVDKGRAGELYHLWKLFRKCGIHADIRLVPDKNTSKRTAPELFTDKRLSYPEYLRSVLRSGILLDINQPGQTALTMRVVESIFLSKKLITNNQDIKNYGFYKEDNIFVLPDNIEDTSEEQIKDFLERPFMPYEEEVIRQFSFEHWKRGF